MNQDWLESVKWDANGLVTAVAQDALTKRVLMVAWMNREALIETATTRRAVYFRALVSVYGVRVKSPATFRMCKKSGWTAMRMWCCC
jgi:hypothetical protein